MKKLEIGEKAMHCNAEAIRNYPEVLRALPFCTWKLEKDSHGRLTKVPYNPRTGFHASVDKPYTFADMEMALKAVENYSGVGINISGKVGCIDVDGCVREDGSLTDTTLAVMALFPDAWVEYSPSGTGLHVYFLIPEGYVATYGQIAELAGYPRAARAVGNALHKNPDETNVRCSFFQ